MKGKVIPIEVKSGKAYKSHKALDNFMNVSDYHLEKASNKKAAMIFLSLPLKCSVSSYRNRTYNRVLGARIHLGNIYNSELIQVKENLDFSNYSVIPCQNKKT